MPVRCPDSSHQSSAERAPIRLSHLPFFLSVVHS
jgi:hypothetical protein